MRSTALAVACFAVALHLVAAQWVSALARLLVQVHEALAVGWVRQNLDGVVAQRNHVFNHSFIFCGGIIPNAC